MKTVFCNTKTIISNSVELQQKLKSIGTTEWIAAGKDVPLTDEYGESYFYILCQGFVRAYQWNGEKEVTREFLFEDDFICSFSGSDSQTNTFFRSMEVLKVCKMYWRDWKQVQHNSSTINKYWARMIEARVSNNINWMDLYRTLSTDEFVSCLKEKKSQALKDDRFVKIVNILWSDR